jgi:hypothetical protein
MVQRGNRDLNRLRRVSTARERFAAGAVTVPDPVDRRNDLVGVDGCLAAALDNGLLDYLHGVLGQQLQDPHVLPGSGGQSLTLLEVGPQLVEARRQRPSGKHEGMIQGGGPATEDGQVMLRLHDPFPAGVAAWVAGNDPCLRDHLDPIHIRLDRYCLEGPATRNTIAVGVEPHRLVLVHLGRLGHERIEGPWRQSQSGLLILLEQLPDRLGPAGHHMVPLGQSTRPQVRIQLGQILHPGHRSGPVPLQFIHAVLHVGLLVAPRRHAEPRIETVIAGQGGVALLELALAALQDGRGHRRRVIPPDLPGHTTEEGKALDHPRQNGLCLLARQRHRKAETRVTPRQQQYRDQLSLLREVHVNVPEVRLQPAARRMGQWDEGLSLGPAHPADITADLVVATRVAVFASQATIELRRRVLLLARGLLILRQNLLDQRLVRTQPWSRSVPLEGVRVRLTVLKHLPDLTPRMSEPPGNLANTHPVPMGKTDLAVVFHRQHPFFSVIRGPCLKALSLRRSLGWVHFRCRFYSPRWVPFTCRFPVSRPRTDCPCKRCCCPLGRLTATL